MIGDPDPYTAVDERRAVLPHLRDRHLDAARGRSQVGRRQAGRARARARPTSRSSTSSRAARRGGGLMEAARRRAPRTRTTTTSTTGRPRPTAPRASSPQLLGMLLFIISEIMVFGAFFTAYFFIRVVGGDDVAGRGHRAAEADRRRQHRDPAVVVVHDALGARVGQARATASACRPAWSRRSCSARRSCSSRSTSTSTSASRRRTARRARSSTASPACTARTCSIGLTLLAFVTIRAFRGHFSPEEHRGVEVPGIYWHFVDVMWIIVYIDGLHHLRRDAQPAALRGARRSASCSTCSRCAVVVIVVALIVQALK